MSNRRFRRSKSARPATTSPRPAAIGPRRDRLKGTVIVASAVAVVGVAFGVAVSTSGSSSAHQSAPTPATVSGPTPTTLSPAVQSKVTAAKVWSAAVDGAFKGTVGVLITYLQATQSWQKGTSTTASMTGELNEALPQFLATRNALAKQAPLSLAPQALDDYRQAAQLYVESARVLTAATLLPAGALRTQLEVGSTRIRDLGDRVFDQGGVLLQPYQPGSTSSGNVVVTLPPAVPVWAAKGLAAGEPLDTPPPGPPPPQPLGSGTRPQTSVSAWEQLVRAAAIPTAAAEVAAIDGSSAPADRTLSDQFDAAAAALTAKPDPQAQPTTSTRLRLGLLVDEEATRTAEAGVLVTSAAAHSQLHRAAQALALIGDDLWDQQVATRSTSFPDDVLTAAAAVGGAGETRP